MKKNTTYLAAIPLLAVLSLNAACAPSTLSPTVSAPRQEVVTTTTTVQASEQAEVVVDKKQQEADVITEQADKVVVNQVSFVYLLLLALGWLLPSPNEMGRWIRTLFIRKRD